MKHNISIILNVFGVNTKRKGLSATKQWHGLETNLRVDLGVTLGVMILHVLKVASVFESRVIPVQFSQPLVNSRVTASDISDVAFKVLDVNSIEADDGWVKTDIGLCQPIAEEIWTAFGKALLNLIQ